MLGLSFSIGSLPSLLRLYGAAKTSWLVTARIAGPRSIGVASSDVYRDHLLTGFISQDSSNP